MIKFEKKLTQRRLKELLEYNTETGDFKRLLTAGRSKKGDYAGYLNKFGYLIIQIDKKLYFAHRLAWLYVYGYFPENEIDHINRVRNDNRIINLREVSHLCNMRNVEPKPPKTGVVGVKNGVKKGTYEVKIKDNGKDIYLGYFHNLYEAAKARLDGEIKYGYHHCNYTSSALAYIKKHDKEMDNPQPNHEAEEEIVK